MIKESSEKTAFSARKLFEKLFPLSVKSHALVANNGILNGGMHSPVQNENVHALAKSSSASEREKAAMMLGEASRYQSFRIVQELMEDEYPSVKKAALLTAGKLKRAEFWHYLMEYLPSRIYGETAVAALTSAGLPLLPELDRHFSRTGQSRAALSKIVHIFRNIGGKQSIQLLRSKLTHPDKEIRHEVLDALAETHYHADKNEYLLLKQALEEEIGCLVWTLASMVDIEKTSTTDLLLSALQWEFDRKKERLYGLLSLMYDSKTIGYIREIMENGSASSRVYALEIVDITIPPEIKQLLLPILEELSPAECLSAFKYLYPQEELAIQERLKDIVCKDHATVNRWTKACALHMIGALGSIESTDVLLANTVSNDMLLAETAVYSLLETAPEKLELQLSNSKKLRESRLKERVLSAVEGKSMLIYDTVCFLKNVNHFKNVAESDIVDIAELTREVDVSSGAEIILHNGSSENCYWVVSGEIQSKDLNKDKNKYYEGAFLGDIIGDKDVSDKLSFIAVRNSKLLQINKYELYEPIINHIGIAKAFVDQV